MNIIECDGGTVDERDGVVSGGRLDAAKERNCISQLFPKNPENAQTSERRPRFEIQKSIGKYMQRILLLNATEDQLIKVKSHS